jgi:competence protein ComEC
VPLSLPLAAAVAAGSAAGLYLFPSAPRLLAILALATAAAAAAARASHARGPTVALLAIAIVSAAGWRAATALREAEHPPLVAWFDARAAAVGGEAGVRDAPVRIRGRLLGDAVQTTYGAQWLLGVSDVEDRGRWVPAAGGVSVTVSGSLLDRLTEWRAGRTIAAPVSIRRPTEYWNEGLPDQAQTLARRGSPLAGSLKSGALVEVTALGAWWDERAGDVRAGVRRALHRHVASRDATSAAIAVAILIGDRAALAPDLERRLQEAGTYHVIAISGGNIALLAAGALALLWCIGVRFAAAAAAAALFLTAHAWIIGGGASVVRATTVACIYLALRLIDQRTAPIHALALAAAGMLAVSPLEIGGAGFWLTFGATTALVMVAARGPRLGRGRWWEPVMAIVTASAAVELLLVPIVAYVFERATVAGLVLNLAAVPAMGVVQAAASLCVASDGLGLDAVAGWSGVVTHLAARALVESSALVAFAPWVTWRVPPPPFAVLASYYALVGAWWWAGTPPIDTLLRRQLQRTTMAAAAAVWIWIAIAPQTLAPPGRGEALRITALDVGQGDALLVTTPDGQTLMVDTGGVPGAFDIGDRVVGPALRARGLRRLDYVVVTHADLDHLGGALTILGEFGPREVWAGVPVGGHPPLERLRAAARAMRTPWRWLQRGDRLELGAVEIRVHHPALPEWERLRVRNDDSLVLEVRLGAVSVWLTGDITRAVEAEILAAVDPVRINVLKAAHHGSLTSSGAEWIRRLHPVAVLVSAGRGNVFGHPAPAVVRRYESAGAAVFRTDLDGQIELVTNGDVVHVSTYTGRRWRLR